MYDDNLEFLLTNRSVSGRFKRLCRNFRNSYYFLIAFLVEGILLFALGGMDFSERKSVKELQSNALFAPPATSQSVLPPSLAAPKKSYDIKFEQPKAPGVIPHENKLSENYLLAVNKTAQFNFKRGSLYGFSGVAGIGPGGLFGMPINEDRIGVILDISGSMESILPEVTQEVTQNFPHAVFIYVGNCNFIKTDSSQKNVSRAGSLNSFRSQGLPDAYKGTHVFNDGSDAVLYLARETDVEAIWFFSDFQDPVMNKIANRLKIELNRRPVKFYMHSVEKEPDPALIELCKATHGDYQVRPLKDQEAISR